MADEAPRIDRSAFEIVDQDRADDLTAYWRTCSFEERLEGIQILRETFYGDQATARLQRVLEFVDQE